MLQKGHTMETLQSGRGVAAPTEEPPYRPRLAYSVWLRVGFAGTCLMTAGIIDYPLTKSQGHPLDAAMAVAAGAILLVIAWRKGAAAMARMSAATADPRQPDAAGNQRLPGWLRLPRLRTLRN
jgi:hypothetical protein